MTKIWLTLAEAAEAANRTERSIRNWVNAGELRVHYGRYRREEVLAAERQMRRRVGRPRKAVLREKPVSSES